MTRDIFLRRLGADTFFWFRDSAQLFGRALANRRVVFLDDVVSCFVSVARNVEILLPPHAPFAVVTAPFASWKLTSREVAANRGRIRHGIGFLHKNPHPPTAG